MANGDGPETPKDLTTQLRSWGSTVASTLVSAIVSVGFVAFAGKAVLWTRFTALQVPADQVVKAVPQSEAVATGASILLIFGFFGALAAVTLYLVDRGGRATLGTSRALLALVMLEGVGAVVLARQVRSGGAVVFSLAALLAIAGTAFAMTFVRRLVSSEDTLHSRPSETLGPAGNASLLRSRRGELRASPWTLLALALPPLGALGLFVGLLLIDPPEWLLALVIGQVVVLAAVEVLLYRDVGRRIRASIRREQELDRMRELAHEQALREDERRAGLQPAEDEKKKREREAEKERKRERLRTGKHRPNRFGFTLGGGLALALLAVAAIALPALILEEWWFAVSICTAVVLSFGLWRIACLAKPGFIWFGLAVFLSVPLFGALTLMARNVGFPEAQPMALIRKTDGPDESIQGLYVTETSDRVYFANVATEGCGDKVKRHSGRLLWVPSKEVVAMSVGPLQSVKEAAKSALEMSYELTPAVETPAAGAVSLTVAEKKSKKLEEAEEKSEIKEVEEHIAGRDQRLQSPGPAVRPNFGSGLSLVPEIASPGEDVELRLSIPNAHVHGFGHRPEGRMLRLNGVPVTVKQEVTPLASNAEYVETEDGQLLTLDKEGDYGVQGGVPFLIEDESDYGEHPRFVKLEDNEVEVVHHGGSRSSEYSEYLKVHGEKGVDELAKKKVGNKSVLPEVKLSGESQPIHLKRILKRQEWHEEEITFEVPRQAKSGVITIDCGQLASSPLLRVGTPPVARIEARMRGGSQRVVFDAGHLRDAAGHPLVDRWTLGRRALGTHRRVVLALKPRPRPYRLRLEVTDFRGVTDTAELLLLRLPESFFDFGSATPQEEKRLEEAQRSLERLARRHSPASIQLAGNADDVGTASFNLALSLRRAERVREALLAPRAQAASAAPHASVPVTLRAFGESCPIVRAPGRQPANRRVDVFILDEGDTVATPAGCKPGREEHTSW